MTRVRIRPSKFSSLVGMVVFIVFVGIGLFVIIPLFGSIGLASGGPIGFFFAAFAVLWTVVSAVGAVYAAVNVFSERGIATTEIDVDGGNLFGEEGRKLPFDERLRRLEQVRQEGLITEQEYQQKREELMRSQW